MKPSVDFQRLQELTRNVRYSILSMTTEAGSGHPTSSLSAAELMTGLLFGGIFKFDPDHPDNPENDRLIFSKGHASPLLYALWDAAGKLAENELLSYRVFGSRLEGHPSVDLPYVEAATGSLGQGLSVGVGMALNAKYLDKLPYRTFVLLGDSEMAEGSVWEAIRLASFYKLGNLIGVLDVNRLGQRGQTMDGWDLESYRRRLSAFGWKTFIIDGHSLPEIIDAYGGAMSSRERPSMLIAKTVKGKGVSFLEDKNGWHGKSVEKEEAGRAIAELGSVDRALRGTIASPKSARGAPPPPLAKPADDPSYPPEQLVATRKAYGNAITRIYPSIPAIVALDGEVGNSTYAELFQKAFPDRFFEMYIAEQNMAGTAVGLARRGKIPFVSTFAAFLTRAFDQIRMAAYSDANVKFVGSHAGVSIGEDGPSQMGLEDIAMFRSILGSVVLYPSDAFCAERLVEEAARHRGIVYIRTTRSPTPLLYSARDSFRIGGSSVLRENGADRATVIAAGITVHEALVAYEELKTEGILIRVVDCYSIKPLDEATLHKAIRETGACITVEDHYQAGGLGEAILASLSHVGFPARLLAVRKKPKSGKTRELLDYEEISRHAIIKAVKEIV